MRFVLILRTLFSIYGQGCVTHPESLSRLEPLGRVADDDGEVVPPVVVQDRDDGLGDF